MKFSIVAPVYNMEPWIAKAIESVLMQEGDFEIEYIMQDGASKDKTVEIFNGYKTKIDSGDIKIRCNGIQMKSFSEKDSGTFDAINKGFKHATGDIYTWADGDNTYDPGALNAIAETFKSFPEIQWVHAVTDVINDKWEKVANGQCRIYRQDWLALGIYSKEAYPTAQNGIFWRKELWKKVQPIPSTYRVSGDYWLWIQMAQHAPMWTINITIGNFMRREGQLHTSKSFKTERLQARPRRSLTAWKVRLFFSLQSRLGISFEKFFIWLYPILFVRDPRPEYITMVDGVPTKKSANSYVC